MKEFILLLDSSNKLTLIIKKKKMYVLIIARYSVRPLKVFYTSPPRRPTSSFQRQLNFSGKHSAMLHKDYLLTYPPLCIAKYSFKQLIELSQRRVNKIAQVSKWQQDDSNPGSLD